MPIYKYNTISGHLEIYRNVMYTRVTLRSAEIYKYIDISK